MEAAQANTWPSLHVGGLRKSVKEKDLAQILTDRQILHRKIKRVIQKPFAFITFDTQEACDAAKAALDGFEYKGCTFSTSDRSHQKRKWETSTEQSKKPKTEIKDVSAPWSDVPYAEQVRRKQVSMHNECVHAVLRETLNSYKERAKHTSSKAKPQQAVLQEILPEWLKPFVAQASQKQRRKRKPDENETNGEHEVNLLPLADCITMEAVRTATSINGYRNKNEFTFGLDVDGRPTVGFRLSSWNEGVTIGSALQSPQVPRAAKLLCAHVTAFLRREGALPVYNANTHVGVYRILTIRYSKRTQDLMCMLCVSLKDVSPEAWESEREQLVAMLRSISRDAYTDDETCDVAEADEAGENFSQEPSTSPLVNSAVLQVYDGLSVPPGDHPIEILFGRDRITETMMGLQFDISPQAFFQVNTDAAEILYSTVIENLPLNAPDAHVLDVCCGTGTIGLCCAKSGAARVTGVEMNGPAVEDAKANARLNNVTNAEFICSKAESVMGRLLRDHENQGSNLVAVVDPPRAGLHRDCLRALRRCDVIQTLVYVACNPTGSLVADAAVLCGPQSKKLEGRPFRAVKAIPVDLFPHTPHCEMVMTFERLPHVASGALINEPTADETEEAEGDEGEQENTETKEEDL